LNCRNPAWQQNYALLLHAIRYKNCKLSVLVVLVLVCIVD
jgi:hypothetical protein